MSDDPGLNPGTVLADVYPQPVLRPESDVYTTEKQRHGYKLVLQGSISPREMQQWLDDSDES